MPRTLPLRRRVSTAARWPVGVVLTSWRYFWRTVPMHRTEEEGDPRVDVPPELPATTPVEDVLRPEDGTGPLFHRRYRTRVRETKLTPEQVI
jgi:hypothetical protein